MLPFPCFPLTVFYDGACPVCAAEMSHYRKCDRSGRLVFVDISTAGFEQERHGISREEFMAQMHAIDQGGTVYRGVEGFWAIWQAFPGSTWYGLLGRVIVLPGVNGLARAGYGIFARFRRYLPRRRHGCTDGTCQL